MYVSIVFDASGFVAHILCYRRIWRRKNTLTRRQFRCLQISLIKYDTLDIGLRVDRVKVFLNYSFVRFSLVHIAS